MPANRNKKPTNNKKNKVGAAARRRRKIFRVKVAVFAAVLVFYGVSACFYRTEMDAFLNLAKYGAADITGIKGGDGAGRADFDKGKLKIHYIDVGQGDAAVIELPDNKTMLIDGGTGKSFKTNFLAFFKPPSR